MRRAALVVLLVVAGCGGSGGELGLRLSDFPEGWREYSSKGAESTCASIVAARKAASEHEVSPDFEHRDGRVATTVVYRYGDERTARRNLATLASDTTRACLSRSLGATAPLDVAPAGDETKALRTAIKATDRHPQATYDLVFVRTGADVVEFVFASVSQPFDQRLREQLTGKVLTRLRAGTP